MFDDAGRVVTPYEGTGHRRWDDSADISAPLAFHQSVIQPAWVDYNGHMSESCYLLVFGDSADAFFRFIGIGEQYRSAGRSLYTVETHIHNRREVSEGETVRTTLQLLDHDAKRLHIFHEMRHGDDAALIATAEQLLVHVDVAAGRSSPMPAYLQQRLTAVQRAHAALPVPEVVGHRMGIGHRTRQGAGDGLRTES